MSQQAAERVTPAPIDLRPPRAAKTRTQMYLVADGVGYTKWVTGIELYQQRPPMKVHAIAWRI